MAGFTKDIEARVRRFIAAGKLLHNESPVIVALSGGADSVALLAILCALGYDCRAAHCNFHLRGEESMRDMRHCRAVADRLDVDLSIRDFDVAARMRECPRESVEMACRELRYAWFDSLLDREGAQAVAVGHHREDRVETFMLNLLRGTGITGLTSMRPRSGNVARPLLELSRAEIEKYLEARGLSFITDSSNSSDVHRRNRLRNTIIPAIEEAFPGASDAILRTIANLESTAAIYKEAVETKKSRYFSDGAIDLAALAENEGESATILFEFLRPLDFSYTQVCDMLSGSTATGARFISSSRKTMASISRGILHLTDAARLEAEVLDSYRVNLRTDISEPLRIAVSNRAITEFAPLRTGASSAFFDAAILDGDPVFTLRHYRRGDRMIPFGATKSKLVSDIFANARFTLQQKAAQWLLTRNDEIIWAPGLKNSALFTLGPDTRRFIRLDIL